MAGETTVNRAQMATAAGRSRMPLGRSGPAIAAEGVSSQLVGGWVGDAATAFTGAFESFSADFTKVINALEGMHEKLVARGPTTSPRKTRTLRR